MPCYKSGGCGVYENRSCDERPASRSDYAKKDKDKSSKLTIELPDSVRLLLNKLHNAGYEAYVVGGCVRDSLLGLTPNDWDICTSATPDEVKACFAEFKSIDTGLKHGTITVLVDDVPYEVTTFRKDGFYSDFRRPNSVTFVSDLKEDLSRRDFTINAMAYSEETGLIDYFGGKDDLTNKYLRCVGDPMKRFDEDALRILRALRFAACYALFIVPGTATAIRESCEKLQHIAAERIRVEMTKLLMGSAALGILNGYSDVVATVIPELWVCIGFNQNNKWHKYNVYEHIAHAVANYKGDDPAIKWALLFHDIGKPLCYTADKNGGHFYGHPAVSARLATEIVNRLRFDNKTADAILELVEHHDIQLAPTYRAARRMLNALGEERCWQLLQVKRADALAHAPRAQEESLPKVKQMSQILKEVLAAEQCFSLKDLAVTGKDLMELGISQGPMVGQTLHHLLTCVMDDRIPNQKNRLLEEAQAFWKCHSHETQSASPQV